jgi:hypothetical protein
VSSGNSVGEQALKVMIAHEMLKQSLSSPPCLPDLHVITELDLTSESAEGKAHSKVFATFELILI